MVNEVTIGNQRAEAAGNGITRQNREEQMGPCLPGCGRNPKPPRIVNAAWCPAGIEFQPIPGSPTNSKARTTWSLEAGENRSTVTTRKAQPCKPWMDREIRN